MLLENINIHRLNLLNFVYVVVIDVEAAIENVRLVLLELLELQIFLPHPNHSGGQTSKFSSRRFWTFLQKPKCHLWKIEISTHSTSTDLLILYLENLGEGQKTFILWGERGLLYKGMFSRMTILSLWILW